MAIEYKERLPDGTFGAKLKVGTDETEAEKVARLEMEKQLLMSTIMEMSSYMASQDDRLAGQESAIMELSMIVAMTMGGGESDV